MYPRTVMSMCQDCGISFAWVQKHAENRRLYCDECVKARQAERARRRRDLKKLPGVTYRAECSAPRWTKCIRGTKTEFRGMNPPSASYLEVAMFGVEWGRRVNDASVDGHE